NDFEPAGAAGGAAATVTVDSPELRHARRRSLLQGIGMAGAAFSASLLPRGARAQTVVNSKRPTGGDIAILRFLAFAELVESDLWQQYAELGGLTQGTQNNYQLALQYLDGDGSQY